MANQHITAAIRCSRFKGITRQLLFALADAASTAKLKGKLRDDKTQDDGKKRRSLGYSKREATGSYDARQVSRD
jgi:hypothetical protein